LERKYELLVRMKFSPDEIKNALRIEITTTEGCGIESDQIQKVQRIGLRVSNAMGEPVKRLR
jgi:hypothetical protein